MIRVKWSYPGSTAAGVLHTTDQAEADIWAANIRRDGGEAVVEPVEAADSGVSS